MKNPLYSSLENIYKDVYNENIRLSNLLTEKNRVVIIYINEITEILQSLKPFLEKMLTENKNTQEVIACYNRIHYLKTLQDNLFVYDAIKNGHFNIEPVPINSRLVMEEIKNNYMLTLNMRNIDLKLYYQKNLFLYADTYHFSSVQ